MLSHRQANNGVTCFVISGELLLLIIHDHRLTFGAHDELVLSLLEFFHRHGATILASGKQRRFIHQVGKISAGETGSTARNQLRLHVFSQWQLAHMHFENLFATPYIWQWDYHLAVKTTWTQ